MRRQTNQTNQTGRTRLTSWTSPKLAKAETIDCVIVDHADGLHEGVADGGADEFEAALEEVFAHRIGLRSFRGDIFESCSAMLDGFAADKGPEILVEGPELLLHGEHGAGILDGGVDLEAVS